MSSFIKLSGSVLSGSQDGAGYALGVSEFQMLDGLSAGTVQASKLTVVDSNKDITGYRSVTGSGDLFFANAVLSGDLRLDDDLTVGDDAAIGGDLDVTGDMTSATITMAEFTVDGSGNTDIDGTLNVQGVPTFQAGAVFSSGITTANAIAGATTVSGSGAFSMSAIDNDGVLNNAGAANIVGKLSVTAVSDLDGGIDVNASALTVSTAGAVAAAGAVSSSAALSGLSLDINGAASISSSGAIAGATNIDASGDLTVGSITMAEFTVDSSGNTDIDGTLNVEGIPTFQAQSVHSAGGTFNSAGLAACGAIAGATTIDASGDLTVGTITMAEFTVDGSGNTDVDGTLNVEGVPTFQAGAVFSSGITTANAIAGATTVSGSGLFSMSAIDNDGVLNNEGAANIVGKLTVSAVSDLDGGIDVNASKFTVSAAGAMLASSAKVADIADGGIVFGSGGDGELSVDAGLGWNSGTATLGATNVSCSANLMAKGTLSANGEATLYGAANVHGTFSALGLAELSGDVNIGNATSDTLTLLARFDSDLLPSTDSARDLGSSALQWAEVHADAGHIDAMTVSGLSALASVSSSAGMHISAKSGPYALSVADGAGDAIAQAWVTHSDRNLKTNIQELDNNAALNAVMSLQPSTYEKKATGKSEIGFIAQEVAQVVPEICALDANGEGRGIDYSRMSTLLAGALKAQQEQIAQLKEIVAKLQK